MREHHNNLCKNFLSRYSVNEHSNQQTLGIIMFAYPSQEFKNLCFVSIIKLILSYSRCLMLR